MCNIGRLFYFLIVQLISSQTPDGFFKKPMLPMAFDALLDVMTTRVDDDRMEKERAAVLSEASMVNKVRQIFFFLFFPNMTYL